MSMKEEQDAQAKKKSQSSKRGGFKALRVARRKAYYAARPMFTLSNKKRTAARHIRNYPEDMQARENFIKNYKEAALNSHLENITNKARRRMNPPKKVKSVRRVK